MREGGGGSRFFDRNEEGMRIFLFLLRGLCIICVIQHGLLISWQVFSPSVLIITGIFWTSKYLGKGYSTKFYTGRLRPEVQTHTFYIPFSTEKVTLLCTCHRKWYPFHIPTVRFHRPQKKSCRKLTVQTSNSSDTRLYTRRRLIRLSE